MKKQVIPVVWGIDKKYVFQPFVVMHSILRHSKENYHFFILTADDVQKNVDELTRILKREYDNFELSVKLVETNCFIEAQIHNQHLSKAAYFRLLIPEIIQEYDKCIYLDCDLIVHGDLKELYEIQLGDNYLAGVKDCHIIADTPREIQHQHILGIPARDKYINSGVLVMGLKKLRQDRIVSYFLEQMKRENWYEDQDVLNVCCYPFIKVLSLKYNLFHFYVGANIDRLFDLPYEKRDFDFDHDKPYILHMGGAYKPWDGFKVKGYIEWRQLAEVFSESKIYQYYHDKWYEAERKDKILDLIDRAKKSRHVMIWGYSDNGRNLCGFLLEYQLCNIEAIVDNKESVWGETYRGIPVKGFHSIDRRNDDTLWLISCRISYPEVIRQLKDNGIDEKNIIRFNDLLTDPLYLLSLHESAYNDMIYRMANREYVRRFPNRDEREQYISNIVNNPLIYAEEYAYLAEKYDFQYWIQTWQYERTEHENNSYHRLPEQ